MAAGWRRRRRRLVRGGGDVRRARRPAGVWRARRGARVALPCAARRKRPKPARAPRARRYHVRVPSLLLNLKFR